jgi:hypothetical protein
METTRSSPEEGRSGSLGLVTALLEQRHRRDNTHDPYRPGMGSPCDARLKLRGFDRRPDQHENRFPGLPRAAIAASAQPALRSAPLLERDSGGSRSPGRHASGIRRPESIRESTHPAHMARGHFVSSFTTLVSRNDRLSMEKSNGRTMPPVIPVSVGSAPWI